MVLRVELRPDQGNRLLKLTRSTRSVVTLRRGQVVLHSAQGFTPPKIAEMTGVSDDYVREIIKAWNAHGFDSLQPKYGGGRPRTFTDEIRKQLANLATSRPKDLGLPFQEWSLDRLRREAVARGIIDDISTTWLGVILDEEAISYQEAKTWKESKDPQLQEKKERIERLLRKKHNPPVVVAADEMGALNLIPRKGKGWHPKGEPHRIPATYHKDKGIRYWFGAYHVGGNRLWGQLEPHKGGVPWLAFVQKIRAQFPADQRIYLIEDNLSAHWTPDNRAWAKAHNMTLVPTATNASWMNPIECRFTELEDLVFSGSNYDSWDEVAAAMDAAAHYRNTKNLPTRRSGRKVRQPLWRRH